MRIWSSRKVVVASGLIPLIAAGLFATDAAGASQGASGQAGSSATAGSGRATVAGTRPSWTRSATDRGPTNGNDQVDLRVWLSMRDPAGLAALVSSVSDPSSAQYGQYLTPAQFDATYAPTAAQADSVAAWLRSSGLNTTVASNDRYVAASGSVAQVQQAFGVSLHDYSVQGHVWRAPVADPSVPSGVRSSVLTVSGLDTGDHTRHPAASGGTIAPPPVFNNAPPLSPTYGAIPDGPTSPAPGTPALPAYESAQQPYVVKGYTPPTLRTAYGVSGTGKGSTVAIVDAYYSSTIVADANQYLTNHDSSSPALVPNSNYIENLPTSFTHNGPCAASGWLGEETLDVEAVHAMAPGATIRYFASASCEDPDFIDALTRVVEDGHANVISNSWSGYEASTTPGVAATYESVFQQAIAEGMTVAFSSGDNGDELAATGTKQVDYPSSDPYVTAVGGTSIGIGSNGAFVGQDGWGTNKLRLNTTTNSWGAPAFLYGAGGGCSALFTEPRYQTLSSSDSNIAQACTSPSGTVARGVPDISMDADPNTGFLMGETQLSAQQNAVYGEYRIGGTSLACPLFSAMLALADAAGGTRIAQANTSLYQLASRALTDIQPHGGVGTLPDVANARADYANSVDASNGVLYSLRTFGQDSSLPVTRGWDQVTGLGTFNSNTVAALATMSPTNKPGH